MNISHSFSISVSRCHRAPTQVDSPRKGDEILLCFISFCSINFNHLHLDVSRPTPVVQNLFSIEILFLPSANVEFSEQNIRSVLFVSPLVPYYFNFFIQYYKYLHIEDAQPTQGVYLIFLPLCCSHIQKFHRTDFNSQRFSLSVRLCFNAICVVISYALIPQHLSMGPQFHCYQCKVSSVLTIILKILGSLALTRGLNKATEAKVHSG